MAGAVFDILGQSGGNPALSREQTLAKLAAVFAVRNGDLGLRTTKTRIADRNIAAMAMMIARDIPDSLPEMMQARREEEFEEIYRSWLPFEYRTAYRRVLGIRYP